jgi:hypothetical protein
MLTITDIADDLGVTRQAVHDRRRIRGVGTLTPGPVPVWVFTKAEANELTRNLPRGPKIKRKRCPHCGK